MEEITGRDRKWKAAAGAVLAAVLALSLALNGVVHANAADEPKAPKVTNTDPKSIVKVEILEGGANGTHLTNLTDSNPEQLLLERGKDYTLSISVHKTNSAVENGGYVRLRFGNEDEGGNVTCNGLVFKNPPGSLYTTGQFEGHSALDAVAVRTDAPNPAYGTNKTYNMQDGVFIYHEKDTLALGSEVMFYMQFTVDDVGYNGDGWLENGLQLQTGTMADGETFVPDATLTASLPVESQPTLKGTFNGTSKTATLGGNGQILTYYTQETNNATEQLGIVYEKSEFDIVYPQGAEIGDYGFNTSYAKEDSTRGKVEKSGRPYTDEAKYPGMTIQHFETTSGYKDKTSDPSYYYYLTFPEDKFKDGQQVTTTLCNMTYTTYLKGSDGATKVITADPPATKVTYTIVDPTKDSTALTAVSRTTGDGVFNTTGVSDASGQALTSLGSCRITNTVSTATPFAKTYEAQFNTTNTAAAITYITVPLGNAENPKVTLTGKKASGEVIDVPVSEPLACRLNNRYSMVFRAEDYGLVAFTAVKADIGQLPASLDTCSWSSNFDVTANLSGAYGSFTTDEPGIVVKNTYRLYNTEPEYQLFDKGNLSVTSQAVSSTEARVGYTASTPGIYDAAGKKAITDVYAGDEVMITGTVYPYQVPYAEGYVKGTNGVTEHIYGNASFITDPVLFVTLPAGMILNTEDFYFQVNKYSYLNDKTTYDYLTSKDYVVENISYMNQSTRDMNLYKITFPDLTLGYLAEGADSNGNTTMLRKQLYFKVKLKTSKGLETTTYYLKDLLGISSENPVTAMPYRNKDSLCTVIEDTYGINGGRDYAAILTDNKSATGFGVQQQAEVNINNAVTVESGEGGGEGEWLSYDPTDPNSILMMGRKTTGQYRLKVTNTGTVASTDVKVLVPLPKTGDSLGAAFMYDDGSGSSDEQWKKFAFTMDVTWKEENLAGFKAEYVILNDIELWNQTVTPQYTVCNGSNKDQANAILLVKDTLAPAESDSITLDYMVDADENLPKKQNLFRNIFRYTTSGTTYSGLGSYVACEIAEGTLSGTAFHDENRNGVQDEGEDPLAGISVMTKDGQGKIQSTTTDESGNYHFSAIREEEVSVTYALGPNETYRFNVAVDGLTQANDKKSATAYYGELPAGAVMNIPLSTYWTLTYDGNEATSGLVPSAQEYDPDNAVATVRVKPDNLYRKYYAFDSWNTEKDGSGTKYLPNSQLTMTGDLTLYAQWVHGTYTATIDYQGGSSDTGPAQFTITYGEKFFDKLPTDVKKTGYTFDGWAGNLTTTGRYNNGATWNMEDGTVYARYAEMSDFGVTYNLDGGNGQVAPLDNIKWTASVVPGARPTKTGYDFKGWTYDGQDVPEGATYGDLAKDDTKKSIELTAKWAPKSGYTVSYDLNIGTGNKGELPAGSVVSPDRYDGLSSVSWTQSGLTPSTVPACDGYAFGGWYYGVTAENEGVAVTSATTYESLMAEGKELPGITLTAKWIKVEGQIVHYDTDGGTPINDKEVSGIDSTNLLPDGTTSKPGYTLNTANPDDPSKPLSGWVYIKDNGNGTKTAIPVDSTTIYSELVGGASSLTLTANWTPKPYTIEYNCAPLGATLTAISKTWNSPGLLSSAAQELVKEGGVGYTVNGWKYNGVSVTDKTTVSDLIPEDTAEDDTIVLTLDCTEKTYSVVYDTTNGSTTSVSTQTGVGYTATGLVPSVTPVKTGYDFSHWAYGTGDAAVTVDGSTTVKDLISPLGESTANSITSLTLTAVYTPKSGFTVKYELSGGSFSTPVGNRTVSWDAAGLIPDETPTKTGHTFSHWSGGRVTEVKPATTYATIAEGNDKEGSSITLVAQWVKDTYNIVYRDADGSAGGGEFSGTYATGAVVPKTHTYGTTTALPTPTRVDYDFAGWYTTPQCTAGSQVTQLGATAYTSGPITLYAKWIQKMDVTGLVKIVYEHDGITQTEAQKTKAIDLILQRRVKGSAEYAQVGDPCPVTFTVPEGAEDAITSFAFNDVPATDENGAVYEYRVTSNTTNYEVERGVKFNQTGDTDYNLQLTYNPNTFDIDLGVRAGDYVSAGDQPVAVRVRVAFRASKPSEVFEDGTTVVTAASEFAKPGSYPKQWIYITEHDDASLAMKLGYGAGTASYPVNVWWDGKASPAYYQFVIDAYQMADGSWIQKGSKEDPFEVTYSQACATYDTATEEADTPLEVTLNRKNTVSFDLQGGTATGEGTTGGSLDAQTVLGGETAGDPSAVVGDAGSITKTGYTLEGWYTDTDWADDHKWNFATSKVAGDTTLSAHWVPNEYDITFNHENGTGATTKKTATYDAPLPELAVTELPTQQGKTFAGYYTEQDGGECYYDAAGKATAAHATYQVADDITLYAHWVDNVTVTGTATIHYSYLNGDEATIVLPENERVEKVTIYLERRVEGATEYETVDQKTVDKTFGATNEENWTATCDYTFENLDPVDSETGKSYEYRVNAKIENYTTDIKQGGNVCDLEFTFAPATFTLPLSVDTSAITTAGDRPTAVNVQVTYYNRAGEEPSGSGYNGTSDEWPVVGQLNGETIALNVASEGSDAGKATGSYPVWQQTVMKDGKAYPSYYQLHVVSYTYMAGGKSVTVPAANAPFFVSSYGTYGAYNNVTDGGVSASIDRTYQVIFDTNGKGDKVPVPQKVARGGLCPEPESDQITAEGYHIAGWYTDAKCTDGNRWDFSQDTVTADTPLFAKWEPNTYTISFYDSAEDMDSGTANTIDTVEATYGKELKDVNAPLKDNCQFNGYYYVGPDDQEVCYYDAQGKVALDPNSYTTPANISLYAKWIEKTDISGKVKINYTYTAGTEDNPQKVIMPDLQRPGSVKVLLQRKAADGTWVSVETAEVQEVIFDRFQGTDVEFAVGTFDFKGMPKRDAAGKEYEYRVTSETANYQVAYGVAIDGDEDEGAKKYNIELTYKADTFYLSMAVDATGIQSDAPVSVDVKVAFIWYQPEAAFNGVVDGNFDTALNRPADPHKWRYLPEFFMNGGSVQNVTLTEGKGTLSYPVTSQGVRTNDATVPEEEKDKVVPYYYQFVITAYHMADGTIVAGSDGDPFQQAWDKWYALNDSENEANRGLTITLGRTYKVSYDLQGKGKTNGGTGEPAAIASQTVRNGSTLTAPSMDGIAEPGYRLVGWYTDKSCTDESQWAFADPENPEGGSASKVTADTSLFAKWVPQTYGITYKDEGDSDFTGSYADGATAPSQHTYGTATPLPTPSKEGCTFAGWYTDPECSAESKVMELGATAYTENIVLYASWVKLSDIKGKVQIDYTYPDPDDSTKRKEMTLEQKLGEFKVALERKPADGQFSKVAEATVHVPEADRGPEHLYAIEDFTFAAMPEADDSGNKYEYRVTAAVSNYQATAGVAINDKTDKYNLLLTYNPNTFAMGIDIDCSHLAPENRPTAANVKVVFCPTKLTEPYDGKVEGEQTKPNPGETVWRYISEHEDGVLTVPLDGDGKGHAECPVLVHQNNDDSMVFYYQFVVYSYEMQNGSVRAESSPFKVCYTGDNYSAYYTEGDTSTQAVSATLDRTYTVETELENLTAPEAPDTVWHGKPLEVKLAPGDNYALPATVTVSIGGKECTAKDLYNSKEGVVRIPGDMVNGDIVIKAVGVRQTCAVQYGLTHVKADPKPYSVDRGTELTTVLQADEHYDLPNDVVVQIGGQVGVKGEDYTYDASSGKLTVPAQKVTDALTITALGIPQAEPPDVAGPMGDEYYVYEAAEPLRVTATGQAGGALSYQWYESATADTAAGKEIKLATKAEYTPSTWVVGTTYYYCVVTNTVTEGEGAQAVAASNSATSAVAQIIVKPKAGTPPVTAQVPKLQPLENAVYLANTPAAEVKALDIGATVADGGELSYQWYKAAEGGQAEEVSGVAGSPGTLVPDVSEPGTYTYYCVVTNRLPNGSVATASNKDHPATIIVTEAGTGTVAQPPKIVDPKGGEYVLGSPIGELAVEVVSQDALSTGEPLYQWYQSFDGSNSGGEKLVGATGKTYTPTLNAVGTYWFYCEVTSTIPGDAGVLAPTAVAASNAAQITITPVLYTVQFNQNDGSGTVAFERTDVLVDETITNPGAVPRPGYVMTGWYRDQGCATPWDFATDTVTENTVLYAGWEACGHEFGPWQVVTPPTATQEGLEKRVCALCGEVEQRAIPKLASADPGNPATSGGSGAGAGATDGSGATATAQTGDSAGFAALALLLLAACTAAFALTAARKRG